MSHSEQERRAGRRRLRRIQRKLDQHQMPAERGDAQEGWDGLVERRIREAMAAGDFDNLPGQGRPLDLTRNPHLDPSLELAYGLLHNSGYVPEWIARDKEIRQALGVARARLGAAWARRQAHPPDESRWQAAVGRFEEALNQLNRKIDDFNLVVPILGCQRARLRLEDELRRLYHE